MILLDWLNILLIAGAFHGIVLLVAINLIKNRNTKANNYLSLLVMLITLSLLGRLNYNDQIIQQYPQLLMIPDFVLFIFGPILFLYVDRLIVDKSNASRPWVHFLLAGAHYAYMMFLAFRPTEAFWELIRSGILVTPMYVLMIGGFLQNAIYLYLSYKKLYAYRASALENISYTSRVTYLNIILGLIALCLLIWIYVLLATLVAGSGPNLEAYKLIWITLTFLIYVLGFYTMNQPELFRMPAVVEKYKGSNLTSSDIQQLSRQLDQLMRSEKPFLNPKLTKPDLAGQINTNTTNLSRVINEGFGKNFFDFVNAYRVEEFIRLVKSGEYENYTLIAIAEEVGFNSKTTFNTAFKKLTNYSPRDYFKQELPRQDPLISLPSRRSTTF